MQAAWPAIPASAIALTTSRYQHAELQRSNFNDSSFYVFLKSCERNIIHGAFDARRRLPFMDRRSGAQSRVTKGGTGGCVQECTPQLRQNGSQLHLIASAQEICSNLSVNVTSEPAPALLAPCLVRLGHLPWDHGAVAADASRVGKWSKKSHPGAAGCCHICSDKQISGFEKINQRRCCDCELQTANCQPRSIDLDDSSACTYLLVLQSCLSARLYGESTKMS